MSMISNELFGRRNERASPRRASQGGSMPQPTVTGRIVFDIAADQVNGTIGLTMVEPHPHPDGPLVGQEPNGSYYIMIPQGKVVQVDLELGGVWKWTFPDAVEEGVTLASAGHAQRYWLVEASSNAKTRRLVIEPSHRPPVAHGSNDDGRNDEKFNIEVYLDQGFGKPLGIEIDPITKNPPPVDPLVPPLNQPGPLL